MKTSIIYIILAILPLVATLLSLKRDLMMLQQNSNRNDRYLRWMRQSGDSTRLSRLVAIIVFLIPLATIRSVSLPVIAQWVVYIASICFIASLLMAKYKKPLVFTKRAVRIYVTAIVLMLVVVGALAWLTRRWELIGTLFIGCYAVSYEFILAANWLLKPVEKRINKRYYDEAAAILASMPDLKVIGITGSYGKTSTKHYLYRILSEQYDVLMTPGNFNTTLGVIRTVREYMKPYNQAFICEMGAKQPGDIREICDLVHPQIGVVTAVGPQHLESFKTIERVQATKFELVDSLPADGLAVVNNDFEMIASREVSSVKCLRYAVQPQHPADYHAIDVEYTPHGTHFAIADAQGEVIRLFTHLVGECNVSNLLAAVIVALQLGVKKEKIRYAVEKIEQVEHRLNMKRTPAGITIIDDAYNSNPVGSAMALDVLAGLRGGKRIVITPGMIELGDDQVELNTEFGKKIGTSADIAIIVGEYNRQAIADGIAEAASDVEVHFAPTFLQAQQLMLSIARSGDAVLYENDLPDTFK